MRDTKIAPVEAARAAIAMRGSNRRTSSSSTNTAPAVGALKAAARPAPAPAAISALASGHFRPGIFPPHRGDDRPHLHAGTFTAEPQPRPDREQAAKEL